MAPMTSSWAKEATCGREQAPQSRHNTCLLELPSTSSSFIHILKLLIDERIMCVFCKLKMIHLLLSVPKYAIHTLNSLFVKIILNTYCVLSQILGTRDMVLSKMNKVSTLLELPF